MATTLATGPDLDDYIKAGQDSSTDENARNLQIRIDGREYGSKTFPAQIFEQPLPPIFRQIADEIRQQSEILGLNGKDISKEQIYSAYEKDLELLQKYLGDFEQMVRSAIRWSIKCLNREGISHEKYWQEFQAKLPQICKGTLLKLSCEMAAKAADILFQELKEEFEEGIIRVVSRMAFWLSTLVDEDFVGIMSQSGPGTCKYHYFEHKRDDQIIGREEHTEHKGDSRGATYGTTTTLTTTREHEIFERHTHHLVNTRQQDLCDFDQRVPRRVAEFIESIPPWLVPYLQIVSGQMTMEEIRRRDVRDETVVTETRSVWKHDPAVIFGRFALLGWTTGELEDNSNGAYYRLQAVGAEAWRKDRRHTISMAAIIAVAVVAIVALIVHEHWESSAKALVAYKAYNDGLSGLTLYKTKTGDALILPGTPRQIRYGGINTTRITWMGTQSVISLVEDISPGPTTDHSMTVWYNSLSLNAKTVANPTEDNTLYGEINLAKIGYPRRLQIVNASDTEITYTVSQQ